MILEVPGVPGTKERELAEKWGRTHAMGGGVSRRGRILKVNGGVSCDQQEESGQEKSTIISVN